LVLGKYGIMESGAIPINTRAAQKSLDQDSKAETIQEHITLPTALL
jgi:hypothetical protein